MSDSDSGPDPAPDEEKPEERLRRIEEETEHLAHEIDEARSAVERARRADSMTSPGFERSAAGAEPWDEESESEEAGHPDKPEAAE